MFLGSSHLDNILHPPSDSSTVPGMIQKMMMAAISKGELCCWGALVLRDPSSSKEEAVLPYGALALSMVVYELL